jgi:serine/threonine protein kinase
MDTESEIFVDFISRCIEWDVDERMTPENAFNHEWIVEGLKQIVEVE